MEAVNNSGEKAKWVKSEIPGEEYVCSLCGGACWYYDVEKSVAQSRFCPTCGAKSGEHFYINFSKETRLSGKREAKSFMKILKGENSKWSKDMLLFDAIDKCLEYKRGNGVRADIRKLRLIREL